MRARNKRRSSIDLNPSTAFKAAEQFTGHRAVWHHLLISAETDRMTELTPKGKGKHR